MSNVLSMTETKMKKYHLDFFIHEKKKKQNFKVEGEIKTFREKR